MSEREKLKNRIDGSFSACVNRKPDANFCKDDHCPLCDQAYLVRKKLESDCRELLRALLSELEQAEARDEERKKVCLCFWCNRKFSFPRFGTREEQARSLTDHAMSCVENPIHKSAASEAALRTLREVSQREVDFRTMTVGDYSKKYRGGKSMTYKQAEKEPDVIVSALAAALAAEGGK